MVPMRGGECEVEYVHRGSECKKEGGEVVLEEEGGM